MRRTVLVSAVIAAGGLLSGCIDTGDGTTTMLTPTDSLEVEQTPAEGSFQAQEVAPVRVDSTEFRDPVYDPGVNVEFHFQGTRYGNYGGTMVHVAVTNLNDVPLPPDALGEPTLRYNAGGGNVQNAELLAVESGEGEVPVQLPLDLPLGPGATTNLHWTFDVSAGNLWDAQFQVGNVIFDGPLNNF